MKELAGHTRFSARRSPGFFEIAALKSLTVKHPVVRDSFLPAPFDQIPQVIVQDKHPAILGFRNVGSQPDNLGLTIHV